MIYLFTPYFHFLVRTQYLCTKCFPRALSCFPDQDSHRMNQVAHVFEVFRFLNMLLFWSLMEEELISQHCAMAGCFYCMHKPPALVLHWLWEVTPWIHTLEAMDGLSSQHRFRDVENFLIHAMDRHSIVVLIDAFINRLKAEEIKKKKRKKSQASSSERWIQTFFSPSVFSLFSDDGNIISCALRKS